MRISHVFRIAVAGVTAEILAAAAFASVAQASVTSVHAVRNIYLRSAPYIGHNSVAVEVRGSDFTVIPGSNYRWWHVTDHAGRIGYVIRNAYWVRRDQTPAASTSVSTPVYTTTTQAPPGVQMDWSVHPVADPSASWQSKLNAVESVAQSKLGTPYIWGHNEDRGQYGFDCSNFTAYVYHHALGYKMSGASQVQKTSVGWTVPNSQMRPGDLLIFSSGAHVGIYVGNGEMIEEGGGLGKVGYLSVKPGSYWGNHLTAVKRMF